MGCYGVMQGGEMSPVDDVIFETDVCHCDPGVQADRPRVGLGSLTASLPCRTRWVTLTIHIPLSSHCKYLATLLTRPIHMYYAICFPDKLPHS